MFLEPSPKNISKLKIYKWNLQEPQETVTYNAFILVI